MQKRPPFPMYTKIERNFKKNFHFFAFRCAFLKRVIKHQKIKFCFSSEIFSAHDFTEQFSRFFPFEIVFEKILNFRAKLCHIQKLWELPLAVPTKTRKGEVRLLELFQMNFEAFDCFCLVLAAFFGALVNGVILLDMVVEQASLSKSLFAVFF